VKNVSERKGLDERFDPDPKVKSNSHWHSAFSLSPSATEKTHNTYPPTSSALSKGTTMQWLD
jgi:hypothetical protein